MSNGCIVGDLPFTVFRNDRLGSAHGGVCVITRDCSVKAAQVDITEKFIRLEVVAIDILNILCPVRFITIYRSPSRHVAADDDLNDLDECVPVSDMKCLIKCLRRLCDTNRSIVITGDLNLSDVNWNEPNLLADGESCSGLFVTFAKQYGFEQYVQDVTRPSTIPGSGSVIDLVLCNDTHILHNVDVGTPFSTSDHCSVFFQVSYLPLKGEFVHNIPADSNYYDFTRCDWDQVKNWMASVDWSDVFAQCSNVEEHAAVFMMS